MLRIQGAREGGGNKCCIRVILLCYVFIADIAVSSYYTMSVNRTKITSSLFFPLQGKTLTDGLESNVLLYFVLLLLCIP